MSNQELGRFIYLNLLDGCRLSCVRNVHCFTSCKQAKASTQWEPSGAWRQFIPTLKDKNIRVLYFSDEAVLMSSAAVKLIKEAVPSVKMVRVACDPDIISDYAVIDDLFSAGIDAIQLRLLGDNEKTHDGIKRPGSFKNTLKFMEYMYKKNFEAHVIIILCDANANELEGIYQLAFAYGAHHIALERTIEPPHALPNRENLVPRLKNVIRRGREEKRIVSLCDPVFLQFHEKKVEAYKKYSLLRAKVDLPKINRTCLAGTNTIAVRANGDVSICRFIPKTIANAFTDDLEAIFVKAALFEAEIRSRNSCANCFLREVCGGCLAYAYKYAPPGCQHDVFCHKLRNPDKITGLACEVK